MDLIYQRGVFLSALDLWLDPQQRQAVAVVSHGHSDHARKHQQTLATAPTHRLMAERRLQATCPVGLPYGQEARFRDGTLTLLPAGHVLGSSQVLVQHGGHRLLYSGDFKLRAGLTAEPAEVPCADTLIMETTFGVPQYRFPPLEEVAGRIAGFCREALTQNSTPVLFAYSLGKSQEVLALLGAAGLPVSVHPSIDAINRIYHDFGVRLPDCEVFRPGDHDGRVLVLPPQARRAAAFATIPRPRTAVVTGWAIDRSAVYRFQCDAAFPLSDHADYAELLEYVERVSPSRIYTVHGFAREFASTLRSHGYEALSLARPEQLRLF